MPSPPSESGRSAEPAGSSARNKQDAYELALGFLLGYGLITKYVLSGSPQALGKGQQLQGQLAKYQGPLGLTAIALAILFLLTRLMR
jgi:hypothetical protein